MRKKAKAVSSPRSRKKSARSPAKAPVVVLHVDDDPNDTALLQAAGRKAEANFDLHNVEDGDEAMDYLCGREKYSDRARYRLPALVLLDLKMPRATGFEILRWIRNHPQLK